MAQLSIAGARQHNLQNIDLIIPHETWVTVVGVSGSGKSSLVWDTVHAEGRRRYMEALAPKLAAKLGGLQRPDVDALVGLRPTLALAQRTHRASALRQVVGLADARELAAVLFARRGVQHCPESGEPLVALTHDEMVREMLSWPEGTRLTLEAPLALGAQPDGVLREVQTQGFSRVRVEGELMRVEQALGRTAPQAVATVVIDRIKVRPDRMARLSDAVRTALRAGNGRLVAVTDSDSRSMAETLWSPRLGALPKLTPRRLDPRHPHGACAACDGAGRTDASLCPSCGGTRLSVLARSVWLDGLSFEQFSLATVAEAALAIGGLNPHPPTELARTELCRRLELAVELGLGHLPLWRPGDQLARGEVQRLRLVRHAGSPLGGVIYVLDEPGVGLHPVDVARVVPVVRRLVTGGATVLAVAHQRALVEAADQVVELGPGPGHSGGRLLYSGSPDALPDDSPTGRWMKLGGPVSRVPRTPTGSVSCAGVRLHHSPALKLELPTGALVAMVGVSGAGKSTLLLRAAERAEPHFGRIVGAEATAAGRSSRSSPATWLGIWDRLRALLARTSEAQVRGLTAASFSLNKAGGRCEACQGHGRLRTVLEVLPDAWSECPVCAGARFSEDVLSVRWKGLHAGQLLGLSAEEAWRHLGGQPKLEAPLRMLVEVGLGYLGLGQPLDTLSGGEAQRLALARELGRAARSEEAVLYTLDEPTAGLHPEDVQHLTTVLHRLVDEGGTVWVATHDAQLAAAADVVIELGPGAGPDGSRVLGVGTPSERAAAGGPSAGMLAAALRGQWS